MRGSEVSTAGRLPKPSSAETSAEPHSTLGDRHRAAGAALLDMSPLFFLNTFLLEEVLLNLATFCGPVWQSRAVWQSQATCASPTAGWTGL